MQTGIFKLRPDGYANAAYARSLSEFGTPIELPACGGSILKRSIGASGLFDAMGPYPLFTCREWRNLRADLDRLDLVSFAAVLDPFGDFDRPLLDECFPDLALPFKEHLVAELGPPLDLFVCTHHRRNARNALKRVIVETSEQPIAWLEDWLALYGHLVRRHRIADIRAFSPCAFEQQFKLPGIVAFRAVAKNESPTATARATPPLGMLLWYTQHDIAYYHLGAYSEEGYALGASFALFWTALEFFTSRGITRASLGAGPGMADASDGLTRFKRGWATGSRTAYFCGRILDRQAYVRLANESGNPATNYFPAYRQGEFCKKKPQAA